MLSSRSYGASNSCRCGDFIWNQYANERMSALSVAAIGAQGSALDWPWTTLSVVWYHDAPDVAITPESITRLFVSLGRCGPAPAMAIKWPIWRRWVSGCSIREGVVFAPARAARGGFPRISDGVSTVQNSGEAPTRAPTKTTFRVKRRKPGCWSKWNLQSRHPMHLLSQMCRKIVLNRPAFNFTRKCQCFRLNFFIKKARIHSCVKFIPINVFGREYWRGVPLGLLSERRVWCERDLYVLQDAIYHKC